MTAAAEFFDLELEVIWEAEASDSMLSLSLNWKVSLEKQFFSSLEYVKYLFDLLDTLVTNAGKSLHSLSNIMDRAEAMSGVFVNEQHHEHVMMLTSTNQVY